MRPNHPLMERSGIMCPACGIPLQSMGIEHIYVDGTSEGWRRLFGSAVVGDTPVLPVELLFCGACGRLQLRMPPSLLAPDGRLLPSKGTLCPTCGGSTTDAILESNRYCEHCKKFPWRPADD